MVKRVCKRRVGCSPEPSVAGAESDWQAKTVAAVFEQNSLMEAMSADTARSCER